MGAPPPIHGGLKFQPQPLIGCVGNAANSGRPRSRLGPCGKLHLTVITAQGARMPLEVGGEDTPAAILQWLCGKSGSRKGFSGLPLATNIDGMRLLHCGQPLDHGTSFRVLGISDKSTIRLLPAVKTARNWGHSKPLPDAPRGVMMTSRILAQESTMRPDTGGSDCRGADVREFSSQAEQRTPRVHLRRGSKLLL